MNSKKRKSYFSNTDQQKRKKLFLQSGMKGFFCTCNGKEKDCIREALNLLEDHSTKMGGEDIAGVNNKDIEQELMKEIKELKNQSIQTKPFQVVETEVKSCVFIKTTIDSPVELACSIFGEVSKEKKRKSKFLIRLLPVEITCKAYIDDIKKAANEIFDTHFKCEPTTYAVMYNVRCNNSVVRIEVIDSLCVLVRDRNRNHTVDLKKPKKAIVVEIIKGVCCLAVVPNFHEYRKYNLVELATDRINEINNDVQNKKCDNPDENCENKETPVIENNLQSELGNLNCITEEKSESSPQCSPDSTQP